MWERTCHYSPLWSRSDDLEIGPIDGADIGLDPLLVEDLADWSRRIEGGADAELHGQPAPGDVPDASEAFLLAARVQRVLGDAWTVWCCAGYGDGGLRGGGWEHTRRSGGPQLLLRAGGPVVWSPSGSAPADGIDPATVQAIEEWRDAALMPGEHRVLGLELCALLQAERPDAHVLWFGGEDVPA